MSSTDDLSLTSVLVVGTGSIAVRHLTVLASFGIIEADVLSRSGRELQVPGVLTRSVTLQAARSKDYDLIVVCSKTQDHVRDIVELAARGTTIVVEKPLAGSVEELDALESFVEEKRRVVVSFPLRFKEALSNLAEYVTQSGTTVVHAHAECRSWLPSWRANRAATSGYWNEQGSGGVALELIHEFDYLDLLWGPLTLLSLEDTSRGILGLRVPESIDAVGQGGKGESISLHLDFCSRVTTRSLHFDLGEELWTWDILRSTLSRETEGSREVQHFPIDDDRNVSFRRQYQEIFWPGSLPLPACSVEDALRLNREVLRVVEESHGR